MKTWKKVLIIIAVIIAILAATFTGGYLYGVYVTNRDAQPDKPDVPQIIPGPDTKPGTITVKDFRFYEDAMRFFIFATGPGSGEVVMGRPAQWMPPEPQKHIIKIGLGGGYNVNQFMPGGSLGYFHRVGSLGGVNAYLGPDLFINAIDSKNVSINIYACVLATF